MKFMPRHIFAAVFAVCLSAPFAVSADSLESIFDEANNAFWNGEYQLAVEKYTGLQDLGVVDSVLAYNLGTSYARLGQLGRAVQHYEQALRQDPSHTDTHHNLSAIREFLARRASEAGRDADLAPAVSAWRAVLDRFSPSSSALSFLVFYIALFAVLVLRRFIAAEMPRLTLGVLAGILAVLTAATFTIAIGKWHQETYLKEAVVINLGQLDVKEGPDSKVRRFAIEEGSRVQILEQQGAWIKLRDSEGRDGWAPSDTLGRI
jgi:tetratricopeptide (TPR) repeat protein